jgi:hypothetical protein
LRAGNLAAIDRGLIGNRLSKIIGVDSKGINVELAKRLSRKAMTTGYNVENQKVTSIDLGRGLFAVAQREVLEVLLNEPKLLGVVKQKITAEVFDVPILRQIATILFETLDADTDASLTAVLAKAESVETGGLIVKLAQDGEEKGNFESRLTGALDVILRQQAQKRKNEIKAIEDQTRFLRCVFENTGKQNPHNLGMT